jgi:hypothetical protein
MFYTNNPRIEWEYRCKLNKDDFYEAEGYSEDGRKYHGIAEVVDGKIIWVGFIEPVRNEMLKIQEIA